MTFSTFHRQGDPAKYMHAQHFMANDKFSATHPQSIHKIYLLSTHYSRNA